MHHHDPIVVYTLTDPIRAELIGNLLRNEGISCILAGIEQANTVGLPGTNDIQIQVPAADVDRAEKLIRNAELAHSK